MLNLFKRFTSGKQDSLDARTVIIHNHLFKNAGSTIDWALHRNFSKGFIDHRDDQEMLRGAEYLGKFLLQYPDIRALSTHHLALPLPDLDNVNLLMITMFRHPIERVRSVYNFERKQTRSSTPGAVHARKYDLKQYVEWRMLPDSGVTIRNFHTVKCLPKNEYKLSTGVTEDNFLLATQTLRETKMIGLVECFDESIVCFEEYLKQFFPDIDLAYKMQNVCQEKKSSREERIGALRLELGEDTFKKLLDNNSWDLKLYDMASRKLADRIRKVPNFTQKLEDFQGRCQEVQG